MTASRRQLPPLPPLQPKPQTCETRPFHIFGGSAFIGHVTLDDFGLPRPEFDYLCTFHLDRRVWPEPPNPQLSILTALILSQSCDWNTQTAGRDQHTFCSLHGLPVGPFSLTTTPVPLRKPRARHNLKITGPNQQCASVCRGRPAFRSGSVPLDATLRSPLHFPPALRRPKPH